MLLSRLEPLIRTFLFAEHFYHLYQTKFGYPLQILHNVLLKIANYVPAAVKISFLQDFLSHKYTFRLAFLLVLAEKPKLHADHCLD